MKKLALLVTALVSLSFLAVAGAGPIRLVARGVKAAPKAVKVLKIAKPAVKLVGKVVKVVLPPYRAK